MHRNQTLAAFCLAATLLSQSGCCCCVTIPVGPDGGEGAEFGEFLPPDSFDAEAEDSPAAPEAREDQKNVSD
jgi:hypothetical protein